MANSRPNFNVSKIITIKVGCNSERKVLFRISTGLLKRNPRWILGVEINYTAVLLCKHFEGLLEAAPQLTLQMYIIIKTGICTQELKGK